MCENPQTGFMLCFSESVYHFHILYASCISRRTSQCWIWKGAASFTISSGGGGGLLHLKKIPLEGEIIPLTIPPTKLTWHIKLPQQNPSLFLTYVFGWVDLMFSGWVKKKINDPCLRRDQWIRFLRPVAAWSFGGGNTALPRGDWWSPHGKKIDIQSGLQKKYFDITEYDKYASIVLKACVNDNLWDRIHDSLSILASRLKRKVFWQVPHVKGSLIFT